MKKKKVILIVEDEIPLIEAIITKLGIHGFDVVSCRSVRQAKNMINDVDHIDAIWLDHSLNDQTGLDLLDSLRQPGTDKKIPVFVVSNSSDEGVMESYQQKGIDKYFLKAHTKLAEIVEELKSSLSTP